jgi:hypothetical protein
MADVAMCLFQAASIAGFDLMGAVEEKLAINRLRKWTVSEDGCLHHVNGSDPREVPARSGVRMFNPGEKVILRDGSIFDGCVFEVVDTDTFEDEFTDVKDSDGFVLAIANSKLAPAH